MMSLAPAAGALFSPTICPGSGFLLLPNAAIFGLTLAGLRLWGTVWI